MASLEIKRSNLAGVLFFASLIEFGCTGLDATTYNLNQITVATASPTPSATPQVAPTPASPPSVTATTGSQTWHNEGIVDTGSGDYGTLWYSPEGDLFVVYSTTPSPSETLLTQVRTIALGSFSLPITVTSSGRTSSMYFQDNSTMWIASEDNANLNILQSTNGGGTWTLQQTYAAVGADASAGYFNSQFLNNGTNLELYYGYGSSSPFGEVSSTQLTQYVAGVWSSVPGLFASPALYIGSLLYNASTTTFVIGGYGVYQSTNNGVTFTQDLNTGSAAQNLANVDVISQRASDSALFTSNHYVLGTSPSNQNWQVWQSTNFGNTWNNLVVYNSILDFTQTATASIGNLVVSIAMVNANQIYSMISYDGGVTWNLPTLLVDLSSGTNIIRRMSLATSSTNIGLLYSEEDGSLNRLGVYLMELF